MQRKYLMKRRIIALELHVASPAAGDDLVYTDRKDCE